MSGTSTKGAAVQSAPRKEDLLTEGHMPQYTSIALRNDRDDLCLRFCRDAAIVTKNGHNPSAERAACSGRAKLVDALALS
jgi:hypothetical protein